MAVSNLRTNKFIFITMDSKNKVVLFLTLSILQFTSTVLWCDAYTATISLQRTAHYYAKSLHSKQIPKVRCPTDCHVLAAPSSSQELSGESSRNYPRKNNRPSRSAAKKKRNPKHDDVWSSGRWRQAVQVESQLLEALESFQQSIKQQQGNNKMIMPISSEQVQEPVFFPDIRECNAALASFGDGGDLLRALRLYFKMRKAASLSHRYPTKFLHRQVPTPTLVTFSTLMSRAVYLGKPLVAIRLWNIMKRQADFFCSDSSVPVALRVVPDVKSANILMNCYAKLGDLDSAQDLLDQMVKRGGKDVPPMKPNLVTYNTLLDACHNAGELDAALQVKKQMQDNGIFADARTFTTLIATVARKASKASGANDPSLAFSLLQEMQSLDIRPNGMTYSALIDVCGRCRRSDLALKGLRLMLDQKSQEQKVLNISPNASSSYTLPSEVGAWTAAINACGKAGRIDTAVKLFYSMPNFGVYPNTVTCGCLTDCLLRNGRTAESLDVLRYMKKYRIAPSEVMYTSLMTSAGRLAQFENKKFDNKSSSRNTKRRGESFPLDESGATKAVEVYTELMTSMMMQSASSGNRVQQASNNNKNNNNSRNRQKGEDGSSSELFQVSLIFQEMKAAGVEPDLACYNALLKSCAKAGDVTRASQVLAQIRASEDLEPNETTWSEMIRAAGKSGRVDIALSTWKIAIDEMGQNDDVKTKKEMSPRSLGALVGALLRSADDENIDAHTRLQLSRMIVKIYETILSGSSYLGMDLVDRTGVLESPGLMIMFLDGLVCLENFMRLEKENKIMDPEQLRRLASSIVSSKCFSDGLPFNLQKNPRYAATFRTAKSWFNQNQG